MKKCKFVYLFFAISLLGLLLVACGNDKSSNLSDDEKKDFIKKGQDVIVLFNNEKSEEIKEVSSEELKTFFTDNQLKEIFGQIKENGDFVEFNDVEVTSVEEKGKAYKVVVQKVKYANKSIIYTISFDKDAKLSGIYYK